MAVVFELGPVLDRRCNPELARDVHFQITDRFNMWFTDTPWPPILICVVIGVILFLVWSSNKRGMYLLAAGGTIVAAAMVFVVEQIVITEAERVEANVYALADAVKADNIDQTMSFFSERAGGGRAKIATAMSLYDIDDNMRITGLQVEIIAANSIGTSRFRANGMVTGKGSGIRGRGTTRWLLTWSREEGEWKITDVKRLHPFREETMELLGPITQ